MSTNPEPSPPQCSRRPPARRPARSLASGAAASATLTCRLWAAASPRLLRAAARERPSGAMGRRPARSFRRELRRRRTGARRSGDWCSISRARRSGAFRSKVRADRGIVGRPSSERTGSAGVAQLPPEAPSRPPARRPARSLARGGTQRAWGRSRAEERRRRDRSRRARGERPSGATGRRAPGVCTGGGVAVDWCSIRASGSVGAD
jgi:hypothetical protein